MNREQEDVIELGVVSADTKGVQVGFADIEDGERILPGLSDD
jgi:hypothetical protein